jgi:hypothetical protein
MLYVIRGLVINTNRAQEAQIHLLSDEESIRPLSICVLTNWPCHF